jgi:hypothetical protein
MVREDKDGFRSFRSVTLPVENLKDLLKPVKTELQELKQTDPRDLEKKDTSMYLWSRLKVVGSHVLLLSVLTGLSKSFRFSTGKVTGKWSGKTKTGLDLFGLLMLTVLCGVSLLPCLAL